MKSLQMNWGAVTSARIVGLYSIMILLDVRESFSLIVAVFAKVDGEKTSTA